ncbi:MAG: V-type ATP synthase subunit F [Lachnospiraceae bacterium]|nr:V-type ATP synthase subunit F [Lachnospiraceae bacterium]
MKMFMISDNTDTLTGMRLAGVSGVEVTDRESFKNALSEAMKRQDLGILLITEKLSSTYPDLIGDARLMHDLPLILDIPDRHGTGRSPNFITDYVNQAIGLKI